MSTSKRRFSPEPPIDPFHITPKVAKLINKKLVLLSEGDRRFILGELHPHVNMEEANKKRHR